MLGKGLLSCVTTFVASEDNRLFAAIVQCAPTRLRVAIHYSCEPRRGLSNGATKHVVMKVSLWKCSEYARCDKGMNVGDVESKENGQTNKPDKDT